jgi:hypothetical protein
MPGVTKVFHPLSHAWSHQNETLSPSSLSLPPHALGSENRGRERRSGGAQRARARCHGGAEQKGDDIPVPSCDTLEFFKKKGLKN